MFGQLRFKGKWRDYQARILEEMDAHFDDRRLHIVAAPGAGKTVLGLELVRRIGRPTLVFSPTIAIREQWFQRLCPLFLAAPPDVSDVSRDLVDPRQLTLATYQALDSVRHGEALDALIDRLNQYGQMTLVLDEAHHLRREWWVCLEQLVSRLADARVVALTATPPYDASYVEWSRYEQLCGPIDLEIGIPELVRNGDLCPHQDHVVLSEPTADALQLLDSRRGAIAQLQHDLCGDQGLLDWLAAHPWLTSSDANIEEILDAPEMLSSVLVLLAGAGRELPTPPLRLLGVSARHVPAFNVYWLERVLDGLLGTHSNTFPLDRERLKALRDQLNRNGLLEGGKVRLHHARSVFQLMASSLGKLDSIVAIAAEEHRSLGDRLRMVVLSDHIRAGELPSRPDAPFQPAKLGVAPIFETLRRAGTAPDYLAVLTGSLVILPRRAIALLDGLARELGCSEAGWRVSKLSGSPRYARIECQSGGSAVMVRLVTALFMRGEIRVLIGTQSLLGEGWDAPALNSLVLASNTASFMLSNQMRGRAIRVDPQDPQKVANIWHLATVDPNDGQALEAAKSAFDWGFLNDDVGASLADIDVVARRMKAFEGIANGPSTLIEDGIGRLGIDPAISTAENNRRSFAIAADRQTIAERWVASLGAGTERARVRETAAARYAPRALSWLDTLQALSWAALGSGAIAAANELRGLASFAGFGAIAMGVAGVATLASLPRLGKALRLVWRNGSLEGSLVEVTWVVLRALHHADGIRGTELDTAHVEIRTSLDGRKDVVVTGVSRATERLAMQALAEILGPVQNPRYLLVRTSWLAMKRRTDYHAVPSALGTRKDLAEHFARLWQEGVGSSQLVFTRTPEGRRQLLRARAQSFAAGFQRAVDRRSVWL